MWNLYFNSVGVHRGCNDFAALFPVLTRYGPRPRDWRPSCPSAFIGPMEMCLGMDRKFLPIPKRLKKTGPELQRSRGIGLGMEAGCATNRRSEQHHHSPYVPVVDKLFALHMALNYASPYLNYQVACMLAMFLSGYCMGRRAAFRAQGTR